MNISNWRRQQKWRILLIVITLALGLRYLSLRVISKQLNEKLVSAKMYHQTGATVIRKEVVGFDQANHSYLNDRGVQVNARPVDQQYRVYYFSMNSPVMTNRFEASSCKPRRSEFLRGHRTSPGRITMTELCLTRLTSVTS